jgi:hypothetical protein
MTNIAALKDKRPMGKGEPPAREAAPQNIKVAPREKKETNKPLQVQVPESVFEAFSQEAGQAFGFSHGAKSKLFLQMWEAYAATKR